MEMRGGDLEAAALALWPDLARQMGEEAGLWRAAPLARLFVAVSGMLTKKVLAVLAVAAVGSGWLYFQQAAATDGDGEGQILPDCVAPVRARCGCC